MGKIGPEFKKKNHPETDAFYGNFLRIPSVQLIHLVTVYMIVSSYDLFWNLWNMEMILESNLDRLNLLQVAARGSTLNYILYQIEKLIQKENYEFLSYRESLSYE